MDKVEQCLPSGYVLAGKEHDYIIENCLGQGSFGITYLAKTRIVLAGNMGRGRGWMQVAVKEFFMRDLNSRDESTLSLQNTADDGLIAKYRRAFLREANNLSQMQHPNIVNVIEVVEANNTAYIVMEYVEGCNLDDYIKSKGAIPEGEALAYFRQLCEAMCYMHEHRMLHLDIKPKNIMHEDDGHVCLIDFGLSKQYTESGEPESSTTIGLGTPGYAPLEQVQQRDDKADFRTTLDVYALGATLYKMLTGKTPPMANEVNDAILDGDDLVRNELRQVGVSETVAKTISTAMWPGAKKRYQTVRELMNALCWAGEFYQADTLGHPTLSVHRVLVDEGIGNDAANSESTLVFGHELGTNPSYDQLPETRMPQKTQKKMKWLLWTLLSIGFILLIRYLVSFPSTSYQDNSPQTNSPQTNSQLSTNNVKKVTNKTIVLTYGHESKRNYIYTGEVNSDGVPNGEGTAAYPETKSCSSATFNGQFYNGITINGTMTFSSGVKYIGTFTNDGFYSEGTLWDKDGYYFKGSFKNGQPFYGSWYTPDGEHYSNVINGQ